MNKYLFQDLPLTKMHHKHISLSISAAFLKISSATRHWQHQVECVKQKCAQGGAFCFGFTIFVQTFDLAYIVDIGSIILASTPKA